jgi:hypothetical protein
LAKGLTLAVLIEALDGDLEFLSLRSPFFAVNKELGDMEECLLKEYLGLAQLIVLRKYLLG